MIYNIFSTNMFNIGWNRIATHKGLNRFFKPLHIDFSLCRICVVTQRRQTTLNDRKRR